MSKYSEMSDFEINKLVAIHCGHQCYYGDGSYTNDGLNVTVKGNGLIGWFNPCRLPEDAWAIIANNFISIIPSIHRDIWFADGQGGEATYHTNPLRAAMIVYLMMKDSE